MALRKTKRSIKQLLVHENLPGLLGVQLKVLEILPGNSSIVVPCKNPNNILELHVNYLTNLRNLKFIQFGHTIVRLIQCIFLIQEFKYHGKPIDGHAVIRLTFFIVVF